MKNYIILCSQLFILLDLNAQVNSSRIKKDRLYINAELGLNQINSYYSTPNDKDILFQAGVGTEYYLLKQWSLAARLKYYSTRVTFFVPDTHSGNIIDFGHDKYSGKFKGEVLSVPLDLKWELELSPKFNFHSMIGIAFTKEIKSEYTSYTKNISTKNPSTYNAFNCGLGISYKLSSKIQTYVNYEIYIGQIKGYSKSFWITENYKTKNALLNFGLKYNCNFD